MAPSKKPSAQKGSRTAAQTPPATPVHPRQPRRRRSASPPNQPIPQRFRDEPPARSTRSAFAAPSIVATMPTAIQRIPIDCPFIDCRATTAHQHLPQLQYYHPRPGRATHVHGYGSSSRESSSRPSLVVTLRTARQDNEDSPGGPEAKEVAASEQASEEKVIVKGDIKAAAQEQPAQELEQNTAHNESPSAERNQGQEAPPTSSIPTLNNSIHNTNTPSTPFQTPLTPPPSSPLESQSALLSSAQQSTPSSWPGEEQQPPPPPTPMDLSDWLPNQNSEQGAPNQPPTPPTAPLHTLTYNQLIRPFLAPHLPPAPGMERITHELQSFRSLHEPLYRPTGMEDMRLVGAGVEDTRLHGVEDTRLHGGGAEYMFQFEDDFDAEAWMWEG